MDPTWIKYANQGATRNLPLSPEMLAATQFLAPMGITMDVFSGGQEATGPNRVGSPRHDHGNAADVMFYKDGRLLDWSNPDDLPIFEEIVRQGRAAGLSGFGAGDGYMRPGSMHLGFGSDAVWGAGGSSSNAPDWLRAAYYGAEKGAVPAGVYSPAGSPQNALAGAPAAPQGNALQRPEQFQYSNFLDPSSFMTAARFG